MNELKTDRGTYTPEDFRIWDGSKTLVITPKFQRRGVWSTPIRSFFIDTLLRDMTVPPIYLRTTQNETKTKQIREVVDGQQRIRCVLEFMDNKFRLSKNLNPQWAGKLFASLSQEQQSQITNYPISSETFKGISDQQVLEVFCRLNMNGVPLNKQELRNGRYFGVFKQTCYSLALSYLEFWRKHKLFTEQSIARMLEVELTSELLIAGNMGMQDKKGTISDYYEKWDDSYPEEKRDEKRFHEIMAAISETFGSETLAQTAFRRPPMFYTLYCVVYHHVYGLPTITRQSPRKPLTKDNRGTLSDAVHRLSDVIEQSKDEEIETPKKYQPFIAATTQQTDNIGPRLTRFNTLYETAF